MLRLGIRLFLCPLLFYHEPILLLSIFFFSSRLGEGEYYERQFATLRSFEEVDRLGSMNGLNEQEDDLEKTQQEKNEFAMKISNFANVILLVFKVFCISHSPSNGIIM